MIQQSSRKGSDRGNMKETASPSVSAPTLASGNRVKQKLPKGRNTKQIIFSTADIDSGSRSTKMNDHPDQTTAEQNVTAATNNSESKDVEHQRQRSGHQSIRRDRGDHPGAASAVSSPPNSRTRRKRTDSELRSIFEHVDRIRYGNVPKQSRHSKSSTQLAGDTRVCSSTKSNVNYTEKYTNEKPLYDKDVPTLVLDKHDSPNVHHTPNTVLSTEATSSHQQLNNLLDQPVVPSSSKPDKEHKNVCCPDRSLSSDISVVDISKKHKRQEKSHHNRHVTPDSHKRPHAPVCGQKKLTVGKERLLGSRAFKKEQKTGVPEADQSGIQRKTPKDVKNALAKHRSRNRLKVKQSHYGDQNSKVLQTDRKQASSKVSNDKRSKKPNQQETVKENLSIKDRTAKIGMEGTVGHGEVMLGAVEPKCSSFKECREETLTSSQTCYKAQQAVVFRLGIENKNKTRLNANATGSYKSRANTKNICVASKDKEIQNTSAKTTVSSMDRNKESGQNFKTSTDKRSVCAVSRKHIKETACTPKMCKTGIVTENKSRSKSYLPCSEVNEESRPNIDAACKEKQGISKPNVTANNNDKKNESRTKTGAVKSYRKKDSLEIQERSNCKTRKCVPMTVTPRAYKHSTTKPKSATPECERNQKCRSDAVVSVTNVRNKSNRKENRLKSAVQGTNKNRNSKETATFIARNKVKENRPLTAVPNRDGKKETRFTIHEPSTGIQNERGLKIDGYDRAGHGRMSEIAVPECTSIPGREDHKEPKSITMKSAFSESNGKYEHKPVTAIQCGKGYNKSMAAVSDSSCLQQQRSNTAGQIINVHKDKRPKADARGGNEFRNIKPSTTIPNRDSLKVHSSMTTIVDNDGNKEKSNTTFLDSKGQKKNRPKTAILDGNRCKEDRPTTTFSNSNRHNKNRPKTAIVVDSAHKDICLKTAISDSNRYKEDMSKTAIPVDSKHKDICLKTAISDSNRYKENRSKTAIPVDSEHKEICLKTAISDSNRYKENRSKTAIPDGNVYKKMRQKTAILSSNEHRNVSLRTAITDDNEYKEIRRKTAIPDGNRHKENSINIVIQNSNEHKENGRKTAIPNSNEHQENRQKSGSRFGYDITSTQYDNHKEITQSTAVLDNDVDRESKNEKIPICIVLDRDDHKGHKAQTGSQDSVSKIEKTPRTAVLDTDGLPKSRSKTAVLNSTSLKDGMPKTAILNSDSHKENRSKSAIPDWAQNNERMCRRAYTDNDGRKANNFETAFSDSNGEEENRYRSIIPRNDTKDEFQGIDGSKECELEIIVSSGYIHKRIRSKTALNRGDNNFQRRPKTPVPPEPTRDVLEEKRSRIALKMYDENKLEPIFEAGSIFETTAENEMHESKSESSIANTLSTTISFMIDDDTSCCYSSDFEPDEGSEFSDSPSFDHSSVPYLLSSPSPVGDMVLDDQVDTIPVTPQSRRSFA